MKRLIDFSGLYQSYFNASNDSHRCNIRLFPTTGMTLPYKLWWIIDNKCSISGINKLNEKISNKMTKNLISTGGSGGHVFCNNSVIIFLKIQM